MVVRWWKESMSLCGKLTIKYVALETGTNYKQCSAEEKYIALILVKCIFNDLYVYHNFPSIMDNKNSQDYPMLGVMVSDDAVLKLSIHFEFVYFWNADLLSNQNSFRYRNI